MIELLKKEKTSTKLKDLNVVGTSKTSQKALYEIDMWQKLF